MKTKAYTQKQLTEAKQRGVEVQKTHGTSAKVGASGRCTMNIPEEAYFNAIDQNGGVQGGKTIWSDKEFRTDMTKRHPELVVKSLGAESRVGPMLGRSGENFSEIFGKSKFDEVEADPNAFLNSQKELVMR